MLLNCLLLAIPVSLDCIGIGITYGIKNTYITNLASSIFFQFYFELIGLQFIKAT